MADKKTTVSKSTKTENKGIQIPELIEFLKAGAHFGHKKSAWNPKMKKYIYEERNGVHIIDLVKSRVLFEKALKAIEQVSNKGYILFVGTKGQAATIIENKAKEVGAFYINQRWPGGLFTNFDIIKKSVNNLIKMEEELAQGGENLVKKEVLMLERDVNRLNRMYEGIKFMDKLPSLIIVIDSKLEDIAIKEARIADIPIVALMDTNCNPELVQYPVPANDDSIKSISLYVDLFAKAVDRGRKSESLISLRKNHIANLKRLEDEYKAEEERQARMEEQERLRMKAMREGKVSKKGSTGVVRVVKKEKNIEDDIKAAEAVKAQKDATSIEELKLSTRTENALKEAGIKNVQGLSGKNKEELKEISGIGEKSADEILKAIK
jgi:small subunit ribosomal protein S2